MNDEKKDQIAAKTLVEIKTNRGSMHIALDGKKAPQTVANFLAYVKEGFYNGTIFHRVIENFMIQGGGFNEKMEQKPTKKTIQNEADNQLKNKVGTIAMARTNDPHSATAQFFINLSDNGFLDHRAKTADGWGYAVFGELTQGKDVLTQIGKVSTTSQRGHQDVPKEAVVIESITVIDNAKGESAPAKAAAAQTKS